MSDATLQGLRPPPAKSTKKSRTPGIIFVVIFHVLLIYALASGLASSTVQLLRGDVEASVVTETQQKNTPPPPPPPDFKPPPPYVPPPDVSINLAPAPTNNNSTAIQEVTNKPAPPPKAAPPPPPPTPPQPTTSHAVTADDYPPLSIRLQEQGVVGIRYLVGTDGNVDKVEITKSSGHDRLDKAAIAMVKRKWKFKPATQGGKPVAEWQRVNVVFRLR